MLNRLALLVGAILLSGCAALLNSSRPRYNGPIVGPAWHNASVQVENTPVIYDGAVYAIGRPFAERNWPRLFAFDLKSGKSLWTSTFGVKSILLGAGSTLFVADDGNRIHTLNAKTGNDSAPSNILSFSKATVSEGVLYTVYGSTVEARPLAGLPTRVEYVTQRTPPLWQASLSVDSPLAPVVGGGNVYVYGFAASDWMTKKRGVNAVYAFDAKTGALRWKWERQDKVGAMYCDGLAADQDAAYVYMLDKSESLFGKGVLMVFDAATGQEKWNHKTTMYAPLGAAPVLLDPHVLVIPDYPPGKQAAADNSGFLYQALDRTTGQKAWESQTNWKYRNAVASGGMLFASEKQVHELLNENNTTTPDSWISAVDLRSGKELWRSKTVELGVFTTPAAGDGMVVVGSKPFTWASPARAGKKDVAGLWAWSMSQ